MASNNTTRARSGGKHYGKGTDHGQMGKGPMAPAPKTSGHMTNGISDSRTIYGSSTTGATLMLGKPLGTPRAGANKFSK